MLHFRPVLRPIERESEVTLKFPEVEKLSPPILMLSDVSYQYPNSNKGKVFAHCDLSATQESRICIVGENGAGKTTLLKLIMDHISPTEVAYLLTKKMLNFIATIKYLRFLGFIVSVTTKSDKRS